MVLAIIIEKEFINKTLKLLQETIVNILNLAFLDDDDGVLESVKHKLVLLFVFQLIVNQLQLLRVDFLDEHEMQYETSDSNRYYRCSAFKNDLRLGDQLLEAYYSAEQKEAGEWNQGDHDALMRVCVGKA